MAAKLGCIFRQRPRYGLVPQTPGSSSVRNRFPHLTNRRAPSLCFVSETRASSAVKTCPECWRSKTCAAPLPSPRSSRRYDPPPSPTVTSSGVRRLPAARGHRYCSALPRGRSARHCRCSGPSLRRLTVVVGPSWPKPQTQPSMQCLSTLRLLVRHVPVPNRCSRRPLSATLHRPDCSMGCLRELSLFVRLI